MTGDTLRFAFSLLPVRNRLKGAPGNVANPLLDAAAITFGKLLERDRQGWSFFRTAEEDVCSVRPTNRQIEEPLLVQRRLLRGHRQRPIGVIRTRARHKFGEHRQLFRMRRCEVTGFGRISGQIKYLYWMHRGDFHCLPIPDTSRLLGIALMELPIKSLPRGSVATFEKRNKGNTVALHSRGN
jgi:hypothetical protein